MNHAGNRGDVSQLMQSVPTPPAQSFDHLVRRSDGQRNENEKSEHSQKDERPFERVLNNRAEVERLVEPRVSEQMQAAVKEREQPQQPPELNHPRQPKNLSQRCDRERETQENERQGTGRVQHKLLRVGPEPVVISVPSEQREWDRAVDENE